MKGIVLVNAYIRAAGMLRQAERMAEELRRAGLEAEVVKNGEILSDVRENTITAARKYDFAVYLDKDKYLPRMLEKGGCAFSTARRPWSCATTRC